MLECFGFFVIVFVDIWVFLLLTGAGEEEKGEGSGGLREKEATQQIKGES